MSFSPSPSKYQEKKVKKLYLGLAAAPVPIGVITHYMRPVNMAPRLISEGDSSINHFGLYGWKEIGEFEVTCAPLV